MNLKCKTDGMPKVYLLNLKEREDRLEIMKTSLKNIKLIMKSSMHQNILPEISVNGNQK